MASVRFKWIGIAVVVVEAIRLILDQLAAGVHP